MIADLDRWLSTRRLPALLPGETKLLQRWLREHGEEWEGIDFNVRLGEGVDMPEYVDEATKRIAKLLSQKRVDAIVTRPDRVGIIEVKERGSAGALGQLLVYQALWQQNTVETRPICLILIVERLAPDVALSLRQLGVNVFIYPEG